MFYMRISLVLVAFVGFLGTSSQAVLVEISGEGTATQNYNRVYDITDSPVRNDIIGALPMTVTHTTTGTTYTLIQGIIDDSTTTSRDARLRFSVVKNGTVTNVADITSAGLNVSQGGLSWSGVATGNGSGITNLNVSSLTGALSIANGGTNNSGGYSSGSIIFSNGTQLVQDNSNLAWDSSTKNLKTALYQSPASGQAMLVYLPLESVTSPGTDNFASNFQGATIGGSPTTSTVVVDANGRSSTGNCITFDGTNDYLSFGDNYDIAGSEDFTFSCWVKSNTVSSGIKTIVSKQAGSWRGFFIGIRPSDVSISILHDFTPNYIDGGMTGHIDDNLWHHIALVFKRSANTAYFYVDGVQTSTRSAAGTLIGKDLSNTATYYIGRDKDGSAGGFFSGSLDEIMQWNRALSAVEVRSLYNTSSQVFAGINDYRILNDFRVGGDAELDGLLRVDNGTNGTNDIATTLGEIYAEGDIEADGNLAVAGNLGIGTTSPSEKLHASSSSSSGTFLKASNTGGDDAGIIFDADRDWRFEMDGDASLGTADYFHLRDDTAGAVRMSVDTSGKVGFGTASPSSPLEVAFSGSTTSISGSEAIRITNTNTTVNNYSNLLFNLTRSTPGQFTAGTISATGSSNAATASMVFATNNAGSLTEKMRITEEGKLGIGTTSPDRKLHVSGSVNGWIAKFVNTAGGTDNDTYRGIEVHCGTSTIDDPTNEHKFIEFFKPDGPDAGTDPDLLANINVTATGGANLSYFSDERLKRNIEPTRLNPNDILNQIEVIDYNLIDGGDNTTNTQKITGFSAQSLERAYPPATNRVRASAYNQATMYDQEELIMISPVALMPMLVKQAQVEQRKLAGVSASITSVSETLASLVYESESLQGSALRSVETRSPKQSNLSARDVNTKTMKDFSQVNVLEKMKQYPALPMDIDKMSIEGRALVEAGLSVGEIDPTSLPIELTGYLNEIATWHMNTDAEWIRANKRIATGDGTMRERTKQEVEQYIADFKSTHRDPATLSAQELGISLANMTSWNYEALRKLLGRVEILEANMVNLPEGTHVPDYVFEPGHARMSLDELKAYVEREKHLPNVPSRDEIEADGFNRDALQMRILEKVEEAILYIIEQAELAKAQKDVLGALRAQNEVLKAEHERLKQDHDKLAREYRSDIEGMKADLDRLRELVGRQDEVPTPSK